METATLHIGVDNLPFSDRLPLAADTLPADQLEMPLAQTKETLKRDLL